MDMVIVMEVEASMDTDILERKSLISDCYDIGLQGDQNKMSTSCTV
jgi:hypothetical protein